ncbi:MAG TPA: class I SAM-dependent RNA methyltransferase, partial [Nannocystis exedens]|nr:class I SAM-dependent RNA methyltransferase [Nannocystis exedens]
MRERDLFVVAAPGLLQVVAEEIAAILPAAKLRPVEGGVELRATDDLDLCRLNLCLRTGSRVLCRIAEIRAASFSELHRRAARLPWEDYLRAGAPVVIRASAKRSRLYHTGGIAERILKGIHERLGAEPQLMAESQASPDAQRIVARLLRDRLTLSIDSSGELLHRRGYRQATAKAPLRENLAASILLSCLRKGDAVIDPMCGAGTLAIEAALLQSGTAPGHARNFALERWPSLTPEILKRARAELPTPRQPPAPIFASDRNPGAIAATKSNAARAGVKTWLNVQIADFTALAEIEAPAARGLIVTNPPYGLRISTRRHLPKLYASLGASLRQRFANRPNLSWRLALLTPDPSLAA